MVVQMKVRKPGSRSARVRPQAGVCQTFYVDEGKVTRALETLPESARVEELADLFGMLGDPTRVRILLALAREELCVCDLARVIDRSISGTSHQLSLLRQRDLVNYRAAGKLAYYKLADSWVARTLRDAFTRFERKAA